NISPLCGELVVIFVFLFMDVFVQIIFGAFIIIGITCGINVGKIKESKDVSAYMGEAMKDMSNFIVLVFAIAQFIAYFEWSNMGVWIAVNGAEFLESINFTGFGLIVGYIIF